MIIDFIISMTVDFFKSSVVIISSLSTPQKLHNQRFHKQKLHKQKFHNTTDSLSALKFSESVKGKADGEGGVSLRRSVLDKADPVAKLQNRNTL